MRPRTSSTQRSIETRAATTQSRRAEDRLKAALQRAVIAVVEVDGSMEPHQRAFVTRIHTAIDAIYFCCLGAMFGIPCISEPGTVPTSSSTVNIPSSSYL